MKPATQKKLIIALAVILGLSIAVMARVLLTQPDGQTVAEVGRPKIGGPFELVDHTGKPFTQDGLKGRLALIYFGYTFCPDVCPTELQSMTLALEELGDDAKSVLPIFITVDPERDTVERMADYVTSFHPSFIGLTGSVAQVETAKKAYKVYAAKSSADGGEPDEDYLMNHSGFVYLMNRDGKFTKHFGPGRPPESFIAAIREHL